MKNKTGKLIVIDGTDGSGKATQVKLLFERLSQAGLAVEIADFPQYGKKSAGLVEEYLGGKYGEAEDVSPYVASIFYSIDRYDASFTIRKWLEQGKVVISNRYTTSNMAHQGGKIKNPLERKAFYDWIKHLEEKIFNIPKPDLTLFLHVDALTAQGMAKQRSKVDWAGKIRDVHEENIRHLALAEKTYIEISQTFPDIAFFSCMSEGRVMPVEQITDFLFDEVQSLLGNPVHSNLDAKNQQNDFLLNNIETPVDASQPTLKIKRLNKKATSPDWSVPENALHLRAHGYHSLLPSQTTSLETGIAICVPAGYSGLILGNTYRDNKDLTVLPQMISPGAEAEIVIRVINTSQDIVNITPDQPLAKLVLQKTSQPIIIKDDSELVDKL